MKEMRTAAGLTQGDLAKLVGVSQSMIAHCESKNRRLATAPHLRYLELYKAWLDHQKRQNTSPEKFLAELDKQHLKVRQWLLQQIKEQEYQLERLHRLLQYRKESFKKAKVLSQMAENWQEVITDKGARIWLQYLAMRSTAELKHCCPAQQQLVKLQIKNAKAVLRNFRDTFNRF